MYALQEAGLTVGAPPAPQPATPTDRLEPRAVEATERTSLTTEDDPSTMYDPASAILQLVESSAQGFAEMLEELEEGETATGPADSETAAGADTGHEVDVYA